MRSAIHATLFAAAPLLAGCSSTDVSLAYEPTRYAAATPAPAPVIAAVVPRDQRKEEPNRLGTIMGGFGNPLKVLNTVTPVGQEVANVFRQALAMRGLLGADAAPYRITLVIHRYDTDQYIGLGARAALDMQVVDRAGRVVYADAVQTSQSSPRFLQAGIFGSMDDMRKMAQDVLDEAVDKLLDKPAFRAAVRGGVTPVS